MKCNLGKTEKWETANRRLLFFRVWKSSGNYRPVSLVPIYQEQLYRIKLEFGDLEQKRDERRIILGLKSMNEDACSNSASSEFQNSNVKVIGRIKIALDKGDYPPVE